MVEDTLPMSLSLYKKSGGEYDSYYHWFPDMEQWWITGFVPDEYNWWFDQDSDNFIKEDQLVQIASVDFQKNPEWLIALWDKWKDREESKNIIVDFEENLLWIISA